MFMIFDQSGPSNDLLGSFPSEGEAKHFAYAQSRGYDYCQGLKVPSGTPVELLDPDCDDAELEEYGITRFQI